jgi:hypothetical protein
MKVAAEIRRSAALLGAVLGAEAAVSGGEAASTMMASGIHGCSMSSLAAWVARQRWVAVMVRQLLWCFLARSEGQLFSSFCYLPHQIWSLVFALEPTPGLVVL